MVLLALFQSEGTVQVLELAQPDVQVDDEVQKMTVAAARAKKILSANATIRNTVRRRKKNASIIFVGRLSLIPIL